jgi:hypothetical protein
MRLRDWRKGRSGKQSIQPIIFIASYFAECFGITPVKLIGDVAYGSLKSLKICYKISIEISERRP